MKYSLGFSIFVLLFASLSAHAELEACGQISYEKNMTCDKPALFFNTTSCGPETANKLAPTKVTCVNNEMIALLKVKSGNFRAVFNKNANGEWIQKGRVWYLKTAKSNSTVDDIKVALKPQTAHDKEMPVADDDKEIGVALLPTPTVNIPTPAAPTVELKPNPETSPTPTPATPPPPAVVPVKVEEKKSEEKSDSWKFEAHGLAFVENESLVNFGEGVTNTFSSTDPLSSQSDTNMLVDLQFTAKKDQHVFSSIFEVGEVFFGDSTTGGNQGLKAKIVKVRNLYVQEEFAPTWFFKAGLWTVSSDPHNFIINDHMSGLSFINENEKHLSQIWYAVATDNKIGASSSTKDTYVGLLHTQKIEEQKSWSAFAVARGLRETFVDNTDLTTSYSGKSAYTWFGLNYTDRKSAWIHSEANAIAVNSKFTDTNGIGNDSNNGWLGHLKFDKDVIGGWNFSIDALGTSGTASSRNNSNNKLINMRGNFATGAPNCAYLLTIATSDGADDAPGSVRSTSGTIAKLDNDEGLRMAVFTVNKSFGEKINSFIRYGIIQSAVAKTSTTSSDMGSEIDVRLQYKISKPSSITFDWGSFKPGAYYTNLDTATLTTLNYRTEF